MSDDDLLDLYSDYLISDFGQTTGTGLAALRDGPVSHDRVQRFLTGPPATSAELWRRVTLRSARAGDRTRRGRPAGG